MTPSINKKNLCVSLITSVEIINHQWMVQLIILKSCEEKWQADKSTDPSDQSEMAKKMDRKGCNKTSNSLWISMPELSSYFNKVYKEIMTKQTQW